MDLRQVDLNLLVAFDVLMTEQNVTAAARKLSVGQSAMSSTLARLRALLNDPVLERRGRSMVPSPLAEALVVPIRETLSRFNSILNELPDFDPGRDHRSFTVMASEYAALAVLQPLLVELRTTAPYVKLQIKPVSAGFLDEMTSDAVHLAIVPSGVGAADDLYCQKELYSDPYLIAVDAANPLVSKEITLDQFSTLPYLASGNGHAPSLIEKQLDRLGIPRRLEVTSSFGLAPFLLRDTPLVTVLPSSFATTIAAGAQLRLLDPPMRLEPMVEAMIWMRHYNDDPAHRWLRGRLAAICAARAQSTMAATQL
ncbi:LysR family transcriptional regulator [Mycolicibacterium sp. CBMA 226]|uniref:LysR family transcriptional regulator n=1 Tax=Mycolicibacterium sp. CBMA 226 TaxID=2606611 RepID=UPI0012DF8BBA|nr:LysR family transcriptional regulator [Mycolicibacterium sp. CBMA 226]MUL78975.1 LysR family transcriptional regulator [Mycolicibacterium sp. CBMA 226]QGW61286.1 Nodulation protein D 2 [Mycolicibacterium sp.]